MDFTRITDHTVGLAFPSLSAGAILLYAIAIAGAITWLRSLPPKNATRLAFRKRTANIIIALAALGVLQMAMRFATVPVAAWPLWSYIIFLAFLGYLGYAFWYSRNKLPALVAESSKVKNFQQRKMMSSKTPAGSDVVQVTQRQERPVATTGRREARRAKKKK
ncbi:MAG: hypothetical protein KAX40_06700 [Herpetosiphon sp.]|nr:hypothetical protein [Herpetosiphon sp.]